MVICNCPDAACAERLATGLLAARLAACVSRPAAVTSTYHWNGAIETAQEFPLHIKTSLSAWPRLQAWLAGQHPYDVPEIIALPIVAGLPDYLAWINQEVNA
ncbi:divalent cation tolerance protein [Andreprevotia lacus DSM 23236]|uniref:Divalent cation tolerance protein n=1 Tax=Andreprevotia lacus DSM 23236 TaxID=1121001 RepID=A0A1W1XKF1_9NEIS|nr:divalent cation tolerance protein [Andreprevotia lacus DSM 23236]